MDKAIKEDWLEALRSGEYVQGILALDTPKGQCCLGVLCDILDLSWKRNIDGSRTYYHGDRMASKFLPSGLGRSLGIPQDIEGELADLNDRGATFEEIADWIEVYL